MKQDLQLKEDIEYCCEFFNKNFSYMPKNIKAGENSVSFRYLEYRIRFPRKQRKEMVTNDYVKEAYISHYIQEQIPDLQIPIIKLSELNGIIFSSHKEIIGKTIIDRLPEDKDNLHSASLSQAEKKTLASDLGAFLARLHSVSLDKADKGLLQSKQMGIEAEEKNQDFFVKNKKLYEDMGIDYKKVEANKSDLVLSHNDFHSGNFVIDKNKRFSGVIDLGEMGINYRFRDFMSLYNFGRGFVRNVVLAYNKHSKHKISILELDFHYLNKIAEYIEYAQKPEYISQSPKLREMFNQGIKDFKNDKQIENQEKSLIANICHNGKI